MGLIDFHHPSVTGRFQTWRQKTAEHASREFSYSLQQSWWLPRNRGDSRPGLVVVVGPIAVLHARRRRQSTHRPMPLSTADDNRSEDEDEEPEVGGTRPMEEGTPKRSTSSAVPPLTVVAVEFD